MSKLSATPLPTRPATRKGLTEQTTEIQGQAARQQFITTALNMSWQLALAVLAPIIGGVELDKAIGSTTTFLIVGLVVAVLASAAVMWQAAKSANQIPVPKLTTAQKRAIKAAYDDEDRN